MDAVRNMLLKSLHPEKETQYRLHVVTGDRRGAGTDANVYAVLHDIHGNKTEPISTNKVFKNDNERGTTTTVDINTDAGVYGPIVKVEVWRDNFADINFLGNISGALFGHKTRRGSAAWFLDRIEVEEVIPQGLGIPPQGNISQNDSGNTTWHLDVEDDEEVVSQETDDVQEVISDVSNNNNEEEEKKIVEPVTVHKSPSGGKVWVFPLQRWVAAHRRYCIHLHDSFLPQEDPNVHARKTDLFERRQEYNYEQKVEGGPVQIENLPNDEKFSEEYYWTFASEKVKLLTKTKFIEWTTAKWKSLEDMRKVYSPSLGEPQCIDVWKEDWWFGAQRIQGVNPTVIKLCREIPENLDVTEETCEGLLEDMTLSEALEKNKMFICDLEILDGIECKEDRELAAPLALLYLNKKNEMMPVAIQLKQKKGPDNPVYTPKDEPNTWLVAKMFYNNSEAQHHQALTHLGYTHLLMEGVVICTHRNLSPSHPLFKLMAPHFLFLLAINTRGLEKLVSPGGWVDNCMTQGVKGIFQLMKRGFDRWSFDCQGQVHTELASRGLLDKEILPDYPYRDDAIPLYNIIKKYVSTVVRHHYDSPEKVHGDWELKWWREELIKPRDQNGVGLQNIPGTEDGFSTVEEVIDTVSAIISTCSLGHAAANFQQYEQYGFVPNYAGILLTNVPKEKKSYTEQDIMAILPDKRMTLDIMVITKLLSSKGTNSLGDFEMQYLYDPVGVQAAEQFKKDLKKLSLETQLRNEDRKWKFEWLDPCTVPNSISV